jgi:hypothetical protein
VCQFNPAGRRRLLRLQDPSAAAAGSTPSRWRMASSSFFLPDQTPHLYGLVVSCDGDIVRFRDPSRSGGPYFESKNFSEVKLAPGVSPHRFIGVESPDGPPPKVCLPKPADRLPTMTIIKHLCLFNPAKPHPTTSTPMLTDTSGRAALGRETNQPTALCNSHGTVHYSCSSCIY